MTDHAARHDPAAPPTIVVPGTGRVRVEPDVATVRLGVSIVRPTAGAAREAAAVAMAAILEAVGAGGVARRDVRTALVGLSPVTDYSSERGPRVTGYQLSNMVEVTVRALDSTGAIIDASLSAGATSLEGLDFRLDDPSAAGERARRAAVDDARQRATTLAEAAGVTVGPVVGIVEGSPPSPPFPFGGVRGMALKVEAADTPIEGGTQEVVVSIVVAFAIG